MEAVLRKELPADGIFCVGDLLAIRCLRVLRRLGVSVPGDTGVVGFGNLGLPGDYGARLTTFDQNQIEVGRQAAQLLEDRIENKGKRTGANSILVQPTLVDMGTCVGCIRKRCSLYAWRSGRKIIGIYRIEPRSAALKPLR